MRTGAWLAGLLIVSSLPALAADADRAREELERELQALVSIPAPRVVIEFAALDEPNFRLESAHFMLDGRPLEVPSTEVLNQEGVHRIFSTELPEGRHELITRVSYVDASSVVLSAQAGFKWKVSSAVRFEVRDGLEVTVRANPERDASERDLKKQLRVKHTQKVAMLAKVDTSIPPPPPKPKLVAAATPPEAEVEDKAVAAPASEPAPVKVASADTPPPTTKVRSRGKRRARETKLVSSKTKVRKTREWAPKSLAAAPEGETVAAAFVARPVPGSGESDRSSARKVDAADGVSGDSAEGGTLGAGSANAATAADGASGAEGAAANPVANGESAAGTEAAAPNSAAARENAPGTETAAANPVAAADGLPGADGVLDSSSSVDAAGSGALAQYVLFAGGGLVVLALIVVVARRRKPGPTTRG